MSRIVWVGVGAAGGIYAYRRSQKAWERTKERGVAGNTAAITRTATAIYRGIREADQPEVVDLTQQATTSRVLASDTAADAPQMIQPEVIDPQAPRPSRSQQRVSGATSSAATKAGTAAAARFLSTNRRSAS